MQLMQDPRPVTTGVTTADQIRDSVANAEWQAKRDTFCLRMTPDVRKYVREQAKKRGITITALINEAIAEHALVRIR